MRIAKQNLALILVASLGAGIAGGCNEIQENPRTWGTIGGAAAGAAVGAAVDDDEPIRGAAVGGVVGGAAGNVGGKIYKDNR